MAHYRITRLTNNIPGDLAPDCITGETPVAVTLRDDDTGVEEQLFLCFDPTVAPCDANGLLHNLNLNGKTPADWDTECGF